MLEFFRGAAKGWTAKIFLGLLVLSFAIWGIADVFTFRGNQEALATVGGKEISAEAYSERLRRALQQYSKQLGTNITLEQARAMGIDRSVLADMMRETAVEAQGESLKLAISDQAVIDEIARNPAFHDSNGKFDMAILRRVLEQNGLSEAAYVAIERNNLLARAIADTPEADFAMPQALVAAMDRHANEQRDVRWFKVSAAESEIAPPTDDELKKHHESNASSYTAPEYRSLAIMKAEIADVSARLPVGDDEVKAAYEKYKLDYFLPETRSVMQIVFPTLDEAKAAKARIDKGETFEKIGEERGLKPADLVLGVFTKEQMLDPAIAEAAFALKENSVSEPVQGKLSIVLVKVSGIVPEKQKTLDEVKAELTTRVQTEKAVEEIRSIYDAVEDARAQQTKFEDIAAKVNIPFILIPAVSAAGEDKDGKTVEVPHKDDLLKLAFESDAGVENDAFATKEEGFVWYEVREVVPSQLRPLDTVKDKVRADLVAQKIRTLALDKAKKLAERAKGGIAFETLATEVAAEIKMVAAVRRNETSADMDQAAVSALFAVSEKAFTAAPDGDGKSAKVIQVQAVLQPKFDSKAEATVKLAKDLADSGGNDLAGIYVSGLQQALGVTINEELWRKITGSQQN